MPPRFRLPRVVTENTLKATLLAMFFFALAPLITLSARSQIGAIPPKFRPVTRRNLLTHISRQSGMGLGEVRELISRHPELEGDDHSPVSAEAGKRWCTVLIGEGQPAERVFRWLPPTGLLPEAALTDKPGPPLPPFADVPVDHPLYTLWKPLLDLDLPLFCSWMSLTPPMRADPLARLTRADWEYLSGIRLPGEPLETTVAFALTTDTTPVTWKEILTTVRLRSTLFKPDEEMVLDHAPTRLEALYLFADVLEGIPCR